MSIHPSVIKALVLFLSLGALSACGQPRAVMLPLQYPDGSPVVSAGGDPVIAGYQTYGTAFHTNATALYQNAAPSHCQNCMQVGTVVTEPSVVRQVTGVVGTAAGGAGSVMTGIGVMDYGSSAANGQLGTTVNVEPNTGRHFNGNVVNGNAVRSGNAVTSANAITTSAGTSTGTRDQYYHHDYDNGYGRSATSTTVSSSTGLPSFGAITSGNDNAN